MAKNPREPLKVFPVRLQPDLHKRLKRYALDHDMTLHEAFVQALLNLLRAA